MRIWMVKPCIFLFILNGRSVLDGVLLVVSLVDSLDTPNFLSLLFFSLLFILRVVLPLFIYCVYLVVLLNTCNLKPSVEHQPLIFFVFHGDASTSYAPHVLHHVRHIVHVCTVCTV